MKLPILETVVMAEPVSAVTPRPEWLTSTELERAAKFVFEQDRETFMAAHTLVRWCAAEALKSPPERFTLDQRCPVHGPGHGRPSLREAPTVDVTLSHTRGYVAAAVGPGRVGVDAEPARHAKALTAAVRQMLAPGDSAEDDFSLLRLWTRKETMIKRGEMTMDDMPRVPWRRPPFLREWVTPEGVMICVAADFPIRHVRLATILD